MNTTSLFEDPDAVYGGIELPSVKQGVRYTESGEVEPLIPMSVELTNLFVFMFKEHDLILDRNQLLDIAKVVLHDRVELMCDIGESDSFAVNQGPFGIEPSPDTRYVEEEVARWESL